MRPRNGFTLIELMIVVVIIGVLAAIALPRFNTLSTSARKKEAEVLLKQIFSLQQAYYSTYGQFAAQTTDLTVVGWAPPTGLQYYALPVVSGGGASTWTACMSAVAPDLQGMSVAQTGDFDDC